jgi:metal-responsive CopG/Arc/MetJ family transcriptional regulator
MRRQHLKVESYFSHACMFGILILIQKSQQVLSCNSISTLQKYHSQIICSVVMMYIKTMTNLEFANV